MNRWTTGAILLLVAALVGGCGGNNTKAGIVITASSTTTGANSVTVPINGTEQFAATVTGVSDTLVYWQVCLPTPISTLEIPTHCTTIPGVTLPAGDTVLSGYGTITQEGFYTAPSSIPNPNSFVILATSPVDNTAFATFTVTIDSGIRVQVTPETATLDAGETQPFTATVTGSSNTSVTWEVNNLAGGDPNNGGTISPAGLYTAPATGATSATIKAVSGADGTTTGTATVTIVTSAPTVTSMEPQVTGQGAAQQEVYLTGTNFTTNGSVIVALNPTSIIDGTVVPYVFLSTSLVRAIIPASLLNSSGTLSVAFQLEPIPPALPTTSNAETLTVTPVRPSIVAASTQAFTSGGSTATLSLTGGYFSAGTPATTVKFDCQCNGENPATTAVTTFPSRQLSVTLPAGSVSNPGLYPLVVQNPGAAAAGQPSMSAINIAVTPSSIPSGGGSIPSIPLASAQPSAIALDRADGYAVVAEEDTNSVAVVSIASKSVVATIPVGTQPTGVAVDDLLPHPIAVVVNSGDKTGSTITGSLSVIDLSTLAPSAANPTPISLSGYTPSLSQPVSIGINPETHRAIVANSSTNLGTIVDLNPAGCTTVPCPVTPLMVIGGTSTGYSTGANPQVGIDPGLNWAVITPGGAGTINIVDLGFGSINPGAGGRTPAVLGSLSISTTIQGVDISAETHEALLTDYNSGSVSTFSILNNTVDTVTLNSLALNVQGELSAAVNPLENIGVALNNAGTGTASIVDLANHDVIQTITNVASGTPQGVVIDPATNNALVLDKAPGAISIIPLGPTPSTAKPLQILQSSPEMTFTSTSALPLRINGMGFASGSTVLLDGAPITSTYVSGRQIEATVPATSLASARHFAVQVQNTDGTVSNVEPLTVVQSIAVGTSPAGVAVDPDHEVAIVSNSGSGDISVISIAPPSLVSQSLGPVGVIGNPLTADLNPRAVAVDSRVGLAVVANYDSNDLSLVDYSEVYQETPYSLTPAAKGCSVTSVCTGPSGIAFNQDTNGFLVTDSNIGTTTSDVAFGSVSPPSSGASGPTIAEIAAPGTPQPVDQTPGDLAIAPSFDPFDPVNNPNPNLTYAAIASSAQTSVIDFLNTSTQLVVGRTTGVSQPTGVIYDSLNHAFLVSDSLNNDIVIVSPLTFVPVFVRGGFDPSSIAYNSQTSTIVAVNGATGTISLLDYLCPPLTGQPACTSPEVRSTLGLVGSQIASNAPLGPKTIDVDPLQNLAVLVDAVNNRVLLIPLPN
jgi:DNA-binding beta-propeller fold protein YncE